ncbi:MAG TPA: GDCCVxC domain-containing (seleno)protein [Pyrinomonadaceae bacterium]|nr:GDCCVxC domain-containing (seleno)protein [Pyrinomonadaceae bacterium]
MSATKTSRTSTITCPHGGFQSEEEMPVDACLFFYECIGCHARLKPLPGDCCVFCSYGKEKCPPQQHEQSSIDNLGSAMIEI